jgi:WhiB family redox-sensing transcriptional regulator
MPQYDQVDWDKAECLGVHTDLFFSVEEERSTQAYMYINAVRSMCARCPIQFACLSYAFAHEAYGVWGGLTSLERLSIHDRHKYPAQRARALKALEIYGIDLKRIKEAYEHSRNDGSLENESANYRKNGVVGYRRPR